MDFDILIRLTPKLCALMVLLEGVLIWKSLPYIAQACVKSFVGWLVMSALYTICVALHCFIYPESELGHLITSLRYTFMAFIPVVAIRFAVDFTGRHRPSRSWMYLVLLVVPLCTVFFAWTPPLGKMLVESQTIVKVYGFWFVESWELGPWFPIHASFSYIIMVGMLAILFVNLLDADYKRMVPAFCMFIGVGLPLLGAFISLSLGAHRGYVPWDIIVGLFGLPLIGIAVLRYRVFEGTPVARTAVFTGMEDAVIILDGNHRVIDANPAGIQLLGERFPEDTTVTAIGLDLGARIPNIEEVFDAEEDPIIEWRNRSLLISVSQVPYGVGASAIRIITFRDVSERQRLIRELDAFARTVAHDLKNPLSAVQGYGQLGLLQLKANKHEDACESLKMSVTMCHRMDRIISELLTLSRIRTQQEVPRILFSPVKVANEALAIVGPLQEKHDADIRIAPDLPDVLGHPPWIQEVLTNYLSNAIKYGGTPPQIRVHGETVSATRVRLFVTDEGPGVPPEKVDALFQEFSQLAPVDGSGHGLGLSIVKRIAERLEGDAGVLSPTPHGKGASFWIELQAAPD